MSLVIRDTLLVSLVALTGAAVLYMQYFASYAVQQQAVWAWVALAVSTALFLKYTQNGKDTIAYIKAARGELRKVVWPTRPDVVKTTMAVGVAVVIFSILVSVLDSILVKFLSKLIG